MAASNWLDCISKSCISTLIRFRWLSIAGHAEATKCAFAVHAIRDLTLSFMPSSVSSRINQARVNACEKKRLFIWSPSPILIPPIIREGSEPSMLIGSYLLRIAKGFFSTRYRQLASALIDSFAICTKTFHAWARIRAYVHASFLSTPNKRAAESCYLPF